MSCELIVERAAANLPQSTQHALFTVAGGRVLVTGIVGEVTTAIQNQANSTQVKVNPPIGTDILLWGAQSIEDRGPGILVGIDRNLTSPTEILAYSVSPFPIRPFVISPGSIDLECAASSTGQMKWLVIYRPLDPGAKVTAA